MDINGTVHCLFEQSGTFKNEFIRLGFNALDYDIKNNFCQTDVVIDLFREIELCFDDKPSLFDTFISDDLILAFFPCIYFCQQNTTFFNGTSFNFKGMSTLQIAELILERSRFRQYYYELALKLFTLCDIRGLRLIVENPATGVHFLRNNFPYKPNYIDKNRRLRGDFFVKPTQYWFVNCFPSFGFTRQKPSMCFNVNSLSGHTGHMCDEDRSLISPDYARNFIKDNILGSSFTSQLLFDF